MKRYFWLSLIVLFSVLVVRSQDIHKSQVPSVIRNNFQKTFPKAKDEDWERKGENFKVEFELGTSDNEHNAWYSKEGLLIRHKEEMSKKNLPEAIRFVINRDYKLYWISEVERIIEGREISYNIKLKSIIREWNLVFSESGEKLSEKRD